MQPARFNSRLFTAVFAATLATTVGLHAQQSSSSIGGIVKDDQGAVIPNAKVTLLDRAQGDVRQVQTNGEGMYLFNPLKPAVYDLTVEISGFKKYEQKDIKTFANDRIVLPDITMAVGGVTETVVVEATAAQVQTAGGEKSGVLTTKQVVDLALNTRNFLDLTRTLPGVVANGGVGGSINGNRNNQNNLLVDGVTNIDTGSNGGVLATMNIDMVAEFKVVTNAAPAEFGRSSGAAISVVTKSGGRDFHGTGYLFHRHESLNANNWLNNQQPQANGLARPRQLYRYNSYGFNVGGPAFIPKLFNTNREKFFFNIGMEWQKQLSPNSLRNVTVPTAAMREGDFSQLRDGSGVPVIIKDPLTGLPFPGNIIPANRINADGQKILKWYPLPNASDNQFNYQTQVSDTFPRRENIYRGDYNINDKWRFYSRFMHTYSQQDRAYGQWNADYNIPFGPMNFGNPGWSGIANLTTVINPTLTNEFVFGSSKNVLNIDPTNDAFKRAKLNLDYKMPFPNADTLSLVQNWRWGGVPNAPFTNFLGTPFRNFNHTWDVSDNVVKVLGTHSMKAGIYLNKSQKDQTAFTSVNGDVWFDRDTNNPGDTNWAFSNALLGNFQRLAQSNTVLNGQYRSWNVEWYAQDSWRATKNLTLDFGIRFYWIQPQYDAALQTSSFNPSLYSRDAAGVLVQPAQNSAGARVGRNPVTGELLPAALIGSLVNNGKGFVNGLYANGMGLAGKNGYPAGLINDRGIHYAPRFGLAYQFLSKTVLRAGWGMFYDRFQGNPVFDMLPNPPSTNRPTYYYGNISTVASQTGTYFPNDVRGFDQGGNVPTTYNYNVSIQRELPARVLLDVGYVGSRGQHLLSRFNLNEMPFGSAWLPQNQDPLAATKTFDGRTTLPINLYRPYPGYGNISITGFGAYSNYNSLQVSANRRFSKTLQFGIAYTWSKTLGVASGDGDNLHPLNFRQANYGVLDYDVPHNFVANYILTLPNVPKTGFLNNPVSRLVLNGWQVSGITSLVGGQPADITVNITGLGGADRNRIYTGSETVAPRVGLAGDPGAVKKLDGWINTSVFRIPLVGSQGLESAQRVVRRPGINNTDLSVFKNVPMFAEGRFLQLRLEMFNAFNHTQFSDFNRSIEFNPTTGAINNLPTSLGGGGGRYGFGAINTVRDPRIIQLAAKFYF